MNKMTSRIALTTAISMLTDLSFADKDDVLTKLNGMVEALDRKASKASSSHKPTAKQVENESIARDILSALSDGEKTIPQLMELVVTDTANPMTSQRMSAILTQLKRSGEVIRCEGKTAIFALANGEYSEEDGE